MSVRGEVTVKTSADGEARATLKTVGQATVRRESTGDGPTQRTTGEASVRAVSRGEARVAGTKY